MVALRLFSLLLALGFAVPAHALTFPYEAVGQAGPNNIIDSNAESCDNSPFNGVDWGGPPVSGQGCYNRTGGLCSADTSHMCDLQLIPAGRCTYGSLASNGGPGGSNTCVWPHGAGHCTGNTRVGCLTDAYIANPAGSTASGPSTMCSSTPGGSNNCVMGLLSDPYGGDFRTDCQCQGTDASLASFEGTVCGVGGAGGTLRAICSDGDPERDLGGYGTGLGVELDALGSWTFANMGPSMNGNDQATTSPPYPIENINANNALEPQRAPGIINRDFLGLPLTVIHRARTTDARDIDPGFNATLGVSKVVAFGDSYWSDWVFASEPITGSFNTHIVVYSCDPPSSYRTDVKIDPTPGAPNSGDEKYCSQLGRDGISFQWSRDLTGPELAAATTCPPDCLKDFDIAAPELQAFINAGLADPDAGAQLAIQSGEGRQAGAGDSIGVAVVTSITWIGANDLRCKMGGWGNPAGEIGRCSDGPKSCVPGAGGDTACSTAGQGSLCATCGGPIVPVTNPLGLPIGYNTHGLPELDLIAGERIGGVSGVNSLVRVPLFVVGTTGYAASDFRDRPGPGLNPVDHADMGEVTAGSTFGPGIGAGGTFTNPSTLAIGELCCDTGANVVWPAAALGLPVTVFNRVFDRGPGPDGIPGCMNDTEAKANGDNACNKHLGKGADGDKADGFYATGRDDVASQYTVGTSGLIPASTNKFGLRSATPAVVTHFSGPPYNYVSPNPKTVNTVASFTVADIDVLGVDNTDVLVKVNTTFCPLIGNNPACSGPDDQDGDGVLDAVDNCPTVANPLVAGVQPDTDADGVGNACDNCTLVANPRVAVGFLTANPWATLSGGQRDDDHDGFGNQCDANFVGPANELIGPSDLGQYRSASGKSRELDVCGAAPASLTQPCAAYDLNGADTLIGPSDLAVYRTLSGKVPGPACTTFCTGNSAALPCQAGATGSCL